MVAIILLTIHLKSLYKTKLILIFTEEANEERDRILDHFNIALDNPVTILHQEQAKTFFSQKDNGKKLWEFVMASTQMQSIQDQYRDSKIQLDIADERLKEKRRHLEDAKQELNDLIKQENSYEKFRFNGEKKEYNQMIKWGWVGECQKAYENVKKKATVIELEIETLKNNLEGWKASRDKIASKIDALQGQNDQYNSDAQAKEDEIKVLRAGLQKLEDQKMHVMSEIKNITQKQGKLVKIILSHY